MARFGSAEGRERAQKIADEAVAAGITDRPADGGTGPVGRSDGMRKRAGGFGQVNTGGSGGGGGGGGDSGDGPGAGGSGDKYKKGQECTSRSSDLTRWLRLSAFLLSLFVCLCLSTCPFACLSACLPVCLSACTA